MKIASIRITPLLYVDEIEKSLSFWIEHLGFERIVDVAEDNRLMFVLLKHGEQELMLNARRFTRRELPAVADFTNPSAAVYLDVPSLAPIKELFDRVEVVVPVHQTNYGTSEVIVREPGGNLVWFAAHE
jgi:catechol 2,3-dioxygenase-like lactoylglutathione lyase family enzyme